MAYCNKHFTSMVIQLKHSYVSQGMWKPHKPIILKCYNSTIQIYPGLKSVTCSIYTDRNLFSINLLMKSAKVEYQISVSESARLSTRPPSRENLRRLGASLSSFSPGHGHRINDRELQATWKFRRGFLDMITSELYLKGLVRVGG